MAEKLQISLAAARVNAKMTQEEVALKMRVGKRTIIKHKLYKNINRKIREIHPGFNIGESTGISFKEERWLLPYSHWSFKPNNYVRDFSKAKK